MNKRVNMSCKRCATKFGIFTKERGCGKCGFSFCDKCLPEKMTINDKSTKVCMDCFQRKEVPYMPPKMLQKRLETLENPSAHPITVYKENPKRASLRKGLSREDMEIVERLEKLNSPRKKSVPSEQEVQERLARLSSAKSRSQERSNLPAAETRTSAQQSEDLMTQMSDLVRIEDSIPKPEDEIADRLATVKGEKPREEGSLPSSVSGASVQQKVEDESDLDEVEKLMQAASKEAEMEAREAMANLKKDEEIQRRIKELQPEKQKPECDTDDSEEEEKLIQKLLAQHALDTELGDNSPTEEKAKDDVEELPWCTLCNDDARLRCQECDGDLYCRRCFKEAHDELDMHHETTPFPS